jgi:hypothetical protein
MKPRLVILLFAALCWGASTPGRSAHAQSPYLPGCWCPYIGGYSSSSWEQLPYFAVFPPVYYHGVTPRTYGYSPFAYVAQAPSSDSSCATPLVVINQYVAGNAAGQPPASTAAPAPRLIKNPYVKP